MIDTDVREYAAQAASTDTFGRVLCSARNHHSVVDGPVQNGCPGEAINPAELFLSGVAACGVELVQVLAKSQAVPLHGIAADIRGTVDRGRRFHRPSDGGPEAERESFGGRSAPPGAACGVQVFGDRDGLLGDRRAAKIYGQVDAGIALPFEDHRHRVGGIHGRFSADTR